MQRPIVVVGGANIEYILKSDRAIERGSKNFVDIEEHYGGSGVNYTLRLLSAGYPVYPLLFLGNDSVGREIRSLLLERLSPSMTSLRQFIEDDAFFVPHLTTPRSTIIVEGHHRTILSQDLNDQNLFRPFIEKRFGQIGDTVSVIIGHIHNERLIEAEDISSLSTSFTISYFRERGSLIYLNMGATQLRYGFDFWKPYLKKVDFIQQNYHEYRRLFAKKKELPTLTEIVEHLVSLKINAIITLDKFGALAITRSKPEQLFVLRPIDLGERFVDSTGAGDAFCAGMVASLRGERNFTQDTFIDALKLARSWAVYACLSYGGANLCPSREEIDTFHKELQNGNSVAVYKNESMQDLLALLDATIPKTD